MIRTNYFSMPFDYILELQRNGKRKKSRCFMEYMVDMHANQVNSISFYCKSWDVSSKGTVHKWIGEFTQEFAKYNTFWDLKNKRHHSNVKNESERQVNDEENINFSQSTVNTDLQNSEIIKSERQVNQGFNLNNSIKTSYLFDKNFLDVDFVYNMNYKYRSDPKETYEYFKKIDIDIDLMKLAVMKYLHNDDQKKFKFINFLKNQIYLNYMPKRIKVMIDDKWHSGVYNNELEKFVTDEGQRTLTAQRLLQLYEEKKLEYIRPEEKVA